MGEYNDCPKCGDALFTCKCFRDKEGKFDGGAFMAYLCHQRRLVNSCVIGMLALAGIGTDWIVHEWECAGYPVRLWKSGRLQARNPDGKFMLMPMFGFGVADELIRIAELNKELLEALIDMVNQHCYLRGEDKLDSMALTANAGAMRLLAELGVVEIEDEYGRRVIGKFKGGSDGK